MYDNNGTGHHHQYQHVNLQQQQQQQQVWGGGYYGGGEYVRGYTGGGGVGYGGYGVVGVGGRGGGGVVGGGGGYGYRERRGRGGVVGREDGGSSVGTVLENEARSCVGGGDGGRRVEEMLMGWEGSLKAGGGEMFGNCEAVEIVVEWYCGFVGRDVGSVDLEGVRGRLGGVMMWVFWGSGTLMEDLLIAGPKLGGGVVRNVLGALKMLEADVNGYIGEGDGVEGMGGGDKGFRLGVGKLHGCLAKVAALDGVVKEAEILDERLKKNATGIKIAEMLAKHTTPERSALARNLPQLWSKLVTASKGMIVEHAEVLKTRLKGLRLALGKVESELQNGGIKFTATSSITPQQYPALLEAVKGLQGILPMYDKVLEVTENATTDVANILSSMTTLAKTLKKRNIHIESISADKMGIAAVTNLVSEMQGQITTWRDTRLRKVCRNVASALDHCISGRGLTFAAEEGRADGRRRSRHYRTKSSPDELLHRYDEELEEGAASGNDGGQRASEIEKREESNAAVSSPSLFPVGEELVSKVDKEKLVQASKVGTESAMNGTAEKSNGVKEEDVEVSKEATDSNETPEVEKDKLAKKDRETAAGPPGTPQRNNKREDRACPSPSRNTPRSRRISHARTMSVDGII